MNSQVPSPITEKAGLCLFCRLYDSALIDFGEEGVYLCHRIGTI